MLTKKNDQSRDALIRVLNARLADAIDLLYQAKQAHWNVTGPQFYALHELFEKIGDELRDPIDDIAERVAQLGGTARGTIRMVAQSSSLPEYPDDLSGGAAHVDALTSSLAACATSMRDAIDQASHLGDEVTADIFVEATRAIDKLHWMVRAHGGAQPAAPCEPPASDSASESTRPRH